MNGVSNSYLSTCWFCALLLKSLLVMSDLHCPLLQFSHFHGSRHNWFLAKSFMLHFSQVKLHFTESALRLIAKKAISKNTGARGLRAILENILMDAMYEVLPLILVSFASLGVI